MATTAAVRDKLAEIDQTIRQAAQAAEGDSSASPVLVAVVLEFARKSAKAQTALAANGTAITERDCVVELEQAGDSAKAAAEADAGASEATRQSVLDAHMAICLYKFETLGS